jgi:hypothetical protein
MNASGKIADRIGALSGLAYVVLMFVAFVSSGDTNPPSPTEPSATLAAYLARSESRAGLSTTLTLLAVLCFFPFLASLSRQIRRAEGPDGWLASLVFGGGQVYAAMLLVMTALAFATRVILDYGGDTQVAKSLYVLGWEFSYVFGPPLTALIGAASVASLLHGALPRWIGWVGLPVVLLLAIPYTTYFGFMFAFPWLTIVSIALLWQTIGVSRTRLMAQAA